MGQHGPLGKQSWTSCVPVLGSLMEAWASQVASPEVAYPEGQRSVQPGVRVSCPVNTSPAVARHGPTQYPD